jgi:hypothetical protein
MQKPAQSARVAAASTASGAEERDLQVRILQSSVQNPVRKRAQLLETLSSPRSVPPTLPGRSTPHLPPIARRSRVFALPVLPLLLRLKPNDSSQVRLEAHPGAAQSDDRDGVLGVVVLRARPG